MHAKELANAHWSYIKQLLTTHELSPYEILRIGFHYRSAFIHGYKHGQEALATKTTGALCEPAITSDQPCEYRDETFAGITQRFRLIPASDTTESFWLADTPVTQALWQAIVGDNPSRFLGENSPVEQVSYEDCQEFINRANSLHALDLRLPTSVEWQHACQAGTIGDHYGELSEIAWYKENSEARTHTVGQKQPNNFGLYDMLGNVWEWTSTRFMSRYFLHGDSWASSAEECRAADRHAFLPGSRNVFLGFRLALTAED